MRKRKHIALSLALILTTSITVASMNNIGNVAVVCASEENDETKVVKGDMNSFTAKVQYGAGGEWKAGDLVEITKDGEYTLSYKVGSDAEEISVLSLETNLYKVSMNDKFKIEAETVTVNEKEYKVDTSVVTWNNSWNDEKPYTYTLINSYADPKIDSVKIGSLKADDKITVKIKVSGTKASESGNEPTEDKSKGNMDKFTAKVQYGAGGEWKAGDLVDITKDGEYTLSYKVGSDAEEINVLSLETNLYKGSMNDKFKIEAETVTVNEKEYKVDTSVVTWNNSWDDEKPYTYTLINSYADPKIDSVKIGSLKADDKITVKIKVSGTKAPESGNEPTEDTSKGNMDKFMVKLTYGADKDWANYSLVITEDGDYTITHIANFDVDKIDLLTLNTNLYDGSMSSAFIFKPEKIIINDTEYNIDISKASWNNSGDEKINPYTYTLINKWANLDSAGLGKIVTGDKITVKFSIKGTHSKLVGDNISFVFPGNPTAAPTKAPESTVAPTAAPTSEPTVEPTKAPESTPVPSTEPTPESTSTAVPSEAPTENPTSEPTAEPTIAPTAKPTKKPRLKKPTLTIKNGNKNISSVKVKANKTIKISVSVNSKAKLLISGISKKESKIAKITFKDGKIIIKGLKKGKVTFKVSSKKTSKYKATSKTITVIIN